MTLKDLKTFINSLDLDNVQPYVSIVSYEQGNDGAKGHAIVSDLADFDLTFIDYDHKPYLSLLTDDFIDSIDFEEE